MNVLLVQFENWQTAMEDFQKNIEKELEEIRRHKAEVRQMKIDLIDHLGQGRYVRDENRIIISAPEIIIGDTDKSGMLQNGSSRVIIRANNINLEGVGSGATDTGSIISRAASIRQIAVDPGIDGTESVVKPTSEIVSQARSLTLKSDDAEGFFSSDALSAGTGIHLSSNSMVSIDATKSCETQSEQLENLEKGLKTIVSDLKEDMKNVKSATASLMSKMKTLVSKDIMNLDAITTRTNYLDIEELHTEFSQLSSSLYNTMTDYFNVLSRLAEANRQLDCVKEQKEEINKMKSSFKEKTTDTFITLQSENINLTSIDGEGNLRTNDGAGINLEGKEISLTSYGNDGALIKEGGIFMGSQEVEINTANPKISDKNIDLPAEGSVRVVSKAIEVEAVDYETKNNKTEEKSLTKEGSFAVRRPGGEDQPQRYRHGRQGDRIDRRQRQGGRGQGDGRGQGETDRQEPGRRQHPAPVGGKGLCRIERQEDQEQERAGGFRQGGALWRDDRRAPARREGDPATEWRRRLAFRRQDHLLWRDDPAREGHLQIGCHRRHGRHEEPQGTDLVQDALHDRGHRRSRSAFHRQAGREAE